MNDYVAWVRSQGGGKGTIGVPAPASVPEFLVKIIGQKYALDMQAAPYRGSAPMMADMLGNQINAGVASIPDFIDFHKAGKVRIVAVLGGARQAILPDVPTFAEAGVTGYQADVWYGIFAPAGTPAPVVNQLYAAFKRASEADAFRQRAQAEGLAVTLDPPEETARIVRAEVVKWRKVVKEQSIKVD
eukprot:gene27957-biopygen20592